MHQGVSLEDAIPNLEVKAAYPVLLANRLDVFYQVVYDAVTMFVAIPHRLQISVPGEGLPLVVVVAHRSQRGHRGQLTFRVVMEVGHVNRSYRFGIEPQRDPVTVRAVTTPLAHGVA